MWQAELRNLVRRRPLPGTLQGFAERVFSNAGDTPALPQLLAAYLGSRADMLPLDECAALLNVHSEALPLPVEAVSRVLREQLGPVAEELVETLEPAAGECDVLVQTHGARTSGGDRVLVKVLRPDAPARAAKDTAALRSAIGSSLFERQFRSYVRTRMDLAGEAAALGMLSTDGLELEIMTCPRVLGRFCTPVVLVTEDVRETLAGDQCSGAEAYAAWIRQTAMGRVFLEEPVSGFRRGHDGGPIIMTGDSPSQSSEASRRKLARYLLALCSDDPDRAADALLAQSEPRRGVLEESEVRRRFRFSTPERESPLEWLDRPSGVSQCITHWRLLRRSGWEPAPPLLAFLRGLTVLTIRNAQDAGSDLLLESLEDIRPHLLVYQTRKILDGIQTGSAPEGIAALARKFFERAPLGLAAAAEGAPSIIAFGSRLLLFAAAGVLAPSIAGMAGPYGNALAAGIVLITGVSALAACRPSHISRRRPGFLRNRLPKSHSEEALG